MDQSLPPPPDSTGAGDSYDGLHRFEAGASVPLTGENREAAELITGGLYAHEADDDKDTGDVIDPDAPDPTPAEVGQDDPDHVEPDDWAVPVNPRLLLDGEDR